MKSAATELRAQYARIAELKAQLAAVQQGVPHGLVDAWELSAKDKEQETTGAGADYNEGVAEGMRSCAKDLRSLLATHPTQQGLDAPWVPVTERLPESAMTEVLVLQMFFEEDGAPRNVFKGDSSLPFMNSVAIAHCHKDAACNPAWRGGDGKATGLIHGPGWRVVAWQELPPTDAFCDALAAQAKQGGV